MQTPTHHSTSVTTTEASRGPRRRAHGIGLVAAAIASATLLAACGDSDAAEPVAGTEVTVVDNDFEPAALEVNAGETVTWRWDARASHDVVGDGFESEVQDSGTFEHTFEEPGEYDYRCTLHGGMDGTVVVEE